MEQQIHFVPSALDGTARAVRSYLTSAKILKPQEFHRGYRHWEELIMQETAESESQNECGSNIVNELSDALRYIGDVSYAILPKDLAHNLGDLKKSFLTTIRSLIDKDIEWVEARVAGGDRVREEWQQRCNENKSEGAPEPIV